MEPKEEREVVSDETGDWDSLERWDSDGGRLAFEASGPEELDPISEDPLSPENFTKVVIIQLARLYDVQLAFLSRVDPNMAQYIGELHKNGEFFGPDPAILL